MGGANMDMGWSHQAWWYGTDQHDLPDMVNEQTNTLDHVSSKEPLTSW